MNWVRLKCGMVVPAKEPTDLEKKQQAEKSRHIRRVRGDIVRALEVLDSLLGDYEQTTHGLRTDGSLSAALAHIQECYDDPSRFNISSASQAIGCFARKERGL